MRRLILLFLLLPGLALAQAGANGPYGIFGGPIPSASLPPYDLVPANTYAFTTDQGLMVNNGSGWVPIGSGGGGGASPGGSLYGLQYNNGALFGGILPGSTGIYCINWSSLSAAPTLTTSCGSGGGGGGSVTSIALTAPSWFTVSGSPITTNGTLAITANIQNANTMLSGPVSGGGASPAFRALVSADIPAIGLTCAGAGCVTPSGISNQIYTSNGTGTPASWQSGITLNNLTADSTPASTDLFLIYSQAASQTESVTGTALASLFASSSTFNNVQLNASQSAIGNGFYNGVSGNQVNISINGASVGEFTSTGLNGTVIGGTTPAAATVAALTATGAVLMDGALTVDGGVSLTANAAGNSVLIGTGTTTGQVTIGGGSNAVVINSDSSGTMNGVTIGATTPEPGTFTALTNDGTVNLNVSNNGSSISLATGSSNSQVNIGGGSNTITLGSSVHTLSTARAVNTGTTSDTLAAQIQTTYESANTASGAFTVTLAAPNADGEQRRICFKNLTGTITWTVTAPATATSGFPTTMGPSSAGGPCFAMVYNSVSGTPTNAPATTWLPF